MPALVGDKFGESLGGSQAPPSFWEVPRLPRKFPELPRKFSATSPEVLSLWNLTAIQRFPGSFSNLPGSSPNFPGSSRTSPEVSPFLWEAWHPLLTHKNFLWIGGAVSERNFCEICRRKSPQNTEKNTKQSSAQRFLNDPFPKTPFFSCWHK